MRDEDWVIDEIDWKHCEQRSSRNSLVIDHEPALETITEEQGEGGDSEDERVADSILSAPFGKEQLKWQRATECIGKRALRLPWWVYTLIGRWILVNWILPYNVSVFIGTITVLYHLAVMYRLMKS